MQILAIQDTPFHEMRYRSSGPKGKARRLTLPFYRAKVDRLPEGVGAFVVASDLQGREADQRLNRLLGEAVAEEIVLLQEADELPRIDFTLLAGDLFDYPDLRKLGGTGEVTRVWNAFAGVCDRVVGVHGNHDVVLPEDLRRNVSILDGNAIAISDLKIGGVSGIIGNTSRNQRKTEREFLEALSAIAKCQVDITVLHQGPDDPANKQMGEPAIRDFLERNGAGLVFFGHCHWKTPLVEMGANQILNVDNRLYVFEE